jgi:hypothetical protein
LTPVDLPKRHTPGSARVVRRRVSLAAAVVLASPARTGP